MFGGLLRSGDEIAPREMVANDEEKNYPRSSAVKNLALRGDGHPQSPAAASAPNYDRSNGGGSADSTRSGEDVIPMKTRK